MKQQPPIVTIKKPCHENWENMTPAQQGRFCQSCSKTVIDFSEMGDDAIIKLLQKSDGTLCGRFYNDQLNRELKKTPEIKSVPFFYKAAASLLLLTELSNADAGTVNPKTEIASNASEAGKNKEPEANFFTPPLTASDTMISGTVKNVHGLGIKCIIRLMNTSLEISSDSNGNFKIPVPNNLLRDFMAFIVIADGYEEGEFLVNRKELPATKHIILTFDNERYIISGSFSNPETKNKERNLEHEYFILKNKVVK